METINIDKKYLEFLIEKVEERNQLLRENTILKYKIKAISDVLGIYEESYEE